MPLPPAIGKQREVVALAVRGHFVVLGTAGSGKTTMAIHRVAFLANPSTPHSGRTLLVTYNKALVTYLRHLRPTELRDVEIRGYHHFARGYLASRHLLPDRSICGRPRRDQLVGQAMRTVAANGGDPVLFGRDRSFFVSEIEWMAHHGIADEAAYIAAERIGRVDARLTRAQRPAMFDVRREYIRLREEAAMMYDWDDIALAVLNEMERDSDERRYRHVVIDEGQDFSPSMIRSLVAAIPADGSVTLFADVAQQIYGRRLSWRAAGLRITTPWRFEQNYRNSPQIAALGLAIAAMPYYAGEPDMVAPTEFAADGPRPTLVRFTDRSAEIEFVIRQARAAAASGTVAIFVPRNADLQVFHDAFPGAQVLDRDLAVWNPMPGVSIGNYYGAKGLEFDSVILPKLSDDNMPDPVVTSQDGADEADALYGRLLYVGVTRARRSLILTYTGIVSHLLPEAGELLQLERR